MIETVPYGPAPDQFGELRQPEGSAERPLVVLIHGGFWREQYHLDLMHPVAESLTEHGYASWNIEYRRVGPSGGGYPSTLDDVEAAIEYMAGGPWPACAVIGHSAGGHLALWNACRDDGLRPDLTIGLAPVADVIAANERGIGADATANFFGGDVVDVPQHYRAGQPDPSRYLGRVVLIHGDHDESVPVDLSVAQSQHVHRLEILETVDHFDVIDPHHDSWQIVLEELGALGAGSRT